MEAYAGSSLQLGPILLLTQHIRHSITKLVAHVTRKILALATVYKLGRTGGKFALSSYGNMLELATVYKLRRAGAFLF